MWQVGKLLKFKPFYSHFHFYSSVAKVGKLYFPYSFVAVVQNCDIGLDDVINQNVEASNKKRWPRIGIHGHLENTVIKIADSSVVAEAEFLVSSFRKGPIFVEYLYCDNDIT